MTDITRRFTVTVSAPASVTDGRIIEELDISRPKKWTVGYYSCERHQGYANYPTFTVAAWFKNDQIRMQHARRMGAYYLATKPEENPDVLLATYLREYTEETMPESSGDDVSGSLLNYMLGTVDWLGLAREFMKEEEQ